jgi:hypothetical protein
MRKTVAKYLSLVVGLLAALTIIFSQAISIEATSVEKTVKVAVGDVGEDTSNEDSPSFYSISATSFPAPAQFSLSQHAACIFEIIFSIEETEEDRPQFELPLNRFFSTILSVIISPNAP